MIPDGTRGWLHSAQDLTVYMGCRHAAELDRLVHTDPALRDWLAEARRADRASAEAAGLPAEEPSVTRGIAHERAVLDSFKRSDLRVVEITPPRAHDDASVASSAAQTIEAMRAGADVIFQATLRDGPWFGLADFLVKQTGGVSEFGNYVYEVHDTKLARTLKSTALIQLAHYGLMLEVMQGAPPPRLVVVLGTGELAAWPFHDAAPYVERLRAEVFAFHHEQRTCAPEPVASCVGCRWLARCDGVWGGADLRHVQRLNRRQRALLAAGGIADMASLASASDDQRPPRMAVETFDRLRAQARVQTGDAGYEVIRPQPAVGALGDIPAPHPLDIYFDLEGDPYAAHPTLDYLWAFCGPDGAYHRRWAHDPAEERQAFAWFLPELREREATGGDWRVYHYNAYETTSLRRIAAAWPGEQRDGLVEEVERFIEQRFVDLYRRVEAGLRTRDGSTSLKIVEMLAGYDRKKDAAAVAKGDDSIKAYECAIAAGTTAARRQQLLDGIEQYNTHDVRATAAVHRWLRELGARLGAEEFVHVEPDAYEQSEKLRKRIEDTSLLEGRLLAAAEQAESDGRTLRCGLSAAGARKLGGMLAWHRREDSVKWTDYFRLCDWARRGEVGPEAEAVDASQQAWSELNGDVAVTGVRPGTEHESVLQDVVLLAKTPPPAGSKKRKCTYRLSCRPGAWKVKAGDSLEVQFADAERRGTADVVEIDPQEGTAVVATTSDLAGVNALVLKPFAGPDGPWLSLMRLAEAALEDSAPAWAQVGLGLLDQRAPAALASVIDRSNPADAARDVIAAMAAGDVLPVQGPPGTGKTWLAAQIVADEIERASAAGRGARIGITANSHKVIDNLLTEVLRVARERKLAVDVAHVNSKPIDGHDAAIEQLDPASALPAWLAGAFPASSLVVGATKYGWSRTDVVGSLQLLIIDEAGQVPLADALSVVQAAPRVLAVGDPQQLAAPIVAAHDAELKVSLLEHLIGDRPTIAPEAGIFLDVSHRMHPALCEVVGRLAYASQLSASKKAAARRLEGTAIDVCGTLLPMRPGVIHLPVSGGPEKEVDAVVELLARLTGGSVLATASGADATATSSAGALATSTSSAETLAPLRAADVLVVAPHNAHVNRLRHELPGYEIGTVDRFQGRQAHVVVYAMGRTAEVPADVPFLYELNRVNVALSRARLLAVVVTSPAALLPPVAEPEHLRLASRFVQALGRPSVRPTSPA